MVNYRFIIIALLLIVCKETVGRTSVNRKNISEENDQNVSMEHFFQDIFLEQLKPDKYQFGHVSESPTDWEQRFEERDFSKNRHRTKVKWGNKNGAYGEHYWDLNH